VSATPVVNALPGAVPFAAAFDAGEHLVLTEAAPNAVATFDLVHGSLQPIDQAATGQAATCWIVRAGDRFYVSNAGSATLSGYRDAGDGALAALGDTPTHPGTVDAAVAGRDLYVQTGAQGIVDAFRIEPDGSLTSLGSVTVPGAVGGEGIAAG
jgi:6-phosphogluconolactonase (cycloisomerase 2 family)